LESVVPGGAVIAALDEVFVEDGEEEVDAAVETVSLVFTAVVERAVGIVTDVAKVG
jgi:hypothetical protein